MTPEGMKELQEALAVTNRIQNRHALMIEDHQRWLEAVRASVREAHQLINQIAAAQLVTDEKLQGLETVQASLREAHQLISQIAAAQLVTEEKLQGLIDALRRGGNGRSR